MRLTTCPDCGEAVEVPLSPDDADLEVTCPICGLCGPAEEWNQFESEDNDTLLGRNLADATIPASVSKSWALRVEQLEEIREVVVELQYQIRLLRQALDELNQDLPQIVNRRLVALQPDSPPTSLPVPMAAVNEPPSAAPATRIPACQSAAAPPQPTGHAKPREPQTKRKAAAASANQSGLW